MTITIQFSSITLKSIYISISTCIRCKNVSIYTIYTTENTTTTARQKKEIKWMLILRSAFPYGVNNKIGEEHQRDSDIPIRISFPYLHKKHTNNSNNSFFNLYEKKLKKNLKSCLNFGRLIISSLNKSKLKELAMFLNEFLNDQIEDFLYLHCYLALIHHVETRLFATKRNTSKQ